MVNLEAKVMSIMENGASRKIVKGFLSKGLKSPVTRPSVISAIDKATRRLSFNTPGRPDIVKQDKYYMGSALLHSIEKALARGKLSQGCIRGLSNIILTKVLVEGVHIRRTFLEKHGFRPPSFVTVSPTNVCNLKCKGCYAGEVYKRHTLGFEIFDRLIAELRGKFGSYFVVISGGEPFAYADGGRRLLDIVERHPDTYFMAYTNGTLIDTATAKRLSELGNFSPAISVEGFESETDGRRGEGTYKKIMRAMDNLSEHGVPFGISATPTRHNAEQLLSDEFIDFYFNRKNAMYGWYFQYMPIGRSPSVELMVTCEQRYRMMERIWRLVREEKVFIGDFWNSGTASDGCMAGGRGGGYFYVMWDGTITPCVFIPFRDKESGNLHHLYESGFDITEALKSPLFRKVREWQNGYWFTRPKEECGNLLAPCIIRDHSLDFQELIKGTGALPASTGAEEFLEFVEEGKMPEYNREYNAIVDPIWEDYLKKTN